MTDRHSAQQARAWPFEEARKVLARVEATPPAKGHVLFETGYGPSGLPHIGTFGEVARTSMVRRAFRELSDLPTRLVAFSDDMDGLRGVPDNVPNKEMMAEHLGKPLTSVPDPFGTHDSFGAHNNARLRGFLDAFGFDYEFVSATERYTTGAFDETLLAILRQHEAVRQIIMPTLGEERRKTYSPFLPVCPKTGRVLLATIEETDAEAGTVTYTDPEGERMTVPVTGGHCKLQWKCDWAMRWVALDVDYEMSGKDLIDSVRLSGRIASLLGGTPPEGFTYELFLDDKGEKISKSKGNGLSVEEWLRYAPRESLALFMYNAPRKAKRLYFDVIPRHVDDYITHLEKLNALDPAEDAEAPVKRLDNPAWHIHAGDPPPPATPLGFALLLNLASACNAEDKAVLWGFIARYAPDVTPETAPLLDRMAGFAVTYYHDFVKPAKTYRAPTEVERTALEDLAGELRAAGADEDAEALMNRVYAVGKRHAFDNLRDWFKALYQVLLGQDQGPRFGSFVALFGRDETVALIERALAGEDLSETAPTAGAA